MEVQARRISPRMKDNERVRETKTVGRGALEDGVCPNIDISKHHTHAYEQHIHA